MRRFILTGLFLLGAWAVISVSGRDWSPAMGDSAREADITRDEFNRIEDGMSYPECVAVIGARGAPFGSSGEPGIEAGKSIEWVSYRWNNASGSSAEISFNFGKVSRKRSFNLR